MEAITLYFQTIHAQYQFLVILMVILVIITIKNAFTISGINGRVKPLNKIHHQKSEREFFSELADYNGGILRNLGSTEYIGRIRKIYIDHKYDCMWVFCQWTLEREQFESKWKPRIYSFDGFNTEYYNTMHRQGIYIRSFQGFTGNNQSPKPILIIDDNGEKFELYNAEHPLCKQDWESLLPDGYYKSLVGKLREGEIK